MLHLIMSVCVCVCVVYRPLKIATEVTTKCDARMAYCAHSLSLSLAHTQALEFYDLAISFFRRACDLEDRLLGLTPLRKVEYMLTEVHTLMDKKEFMQVLRRRL